MNLEAIMESGELPPGLPLRSLEDLKLALTYRIATIKNSFVEDSFVDLLTHYQTLYERVVTELNAHYGVDGMTPIAL